MRKGGRPGEPALSEVEGSSGWDLGFPIALEEICDPKVPAFGAWDSR